jgi:hypothetical protein
MITARRCIMHSRERRRATLDQELRNRAQLKVLGKLGGQIDAGSLLRDLYYKSDSSTRKELEGARERR